jgi:hypothetical protein
MVTVVIIIDRALERREGGGADAGAGGGRGCGCSCGPVGDVKELRLCMGTDTGEERG